MISKIMYLVEKFLPQECPKCRHKFDKIGLDWTPLMGDVVNNERVFRETGGYSIIVCSQCQNFTACIALESYALSDPKTAKKLLKRGFVNLRKVRALGAMAEDRHVIYTKLLDCHIEKVKGKFLKP